MHATEYIFAESAVWQQQAADWIADRIRSAITQRGYCIVGLSGGSTPVPVYQSLATKEIDWSRVTIFLVDERCVPPTDTQSNQYVLRTALLNALPVSPHCIFPDTTLPPDACADVYNASLLSALHDRDVDLLVLGLGTDGHTASLFPPVSPSIDLDRLVIHTQTDQFSVLDRISITPFVLQAAVATLFLLQGNEKRDVWQTMLAAPFDPQHCPAHNGLSGQRATLFACWS